MSSKSSTTTDIICKYCDKAFSKRCHLYAHIRNINKTEPTLTRKPKLVCPSCSGLFPSYNELRDHLIITHGKEIYKEEHIFENIDDFQVWKELKEKELKCFYVKTRGISIGSKTNRTYYVCHRSLKSQRSGSISQNKPCKSTKSQGSAKLTISCPSTLELIMNEIDKPKAILFTPHIGHQCSLTHINLTKTERKQIAGKILQGVSFERILDDIRDEIKSEDSFGRLSLLDKQDLRNITKEFSLQANVKLHDNDAISVQLWIERMKTLNEDSPILFYKPQGSSEYAEEFEKNDFILIIMTKFQQSQLIKFGSDKICVDTTHGTTNYDFLLTTLLVVDELGQGIPSAFLLSNRADTSLLTHFFQSIKIQTGPITAKVFMSDDAPEFYNAWTSVMGTPEYRLLCAWHVDKNWRKNLNKIVGDQELKAKVYKSLRILLQCQNPEEFEDLLNLVVSELLSHKDTVNFGEYFQKYYASRCHMWAYCFRKGLGINTNMYLEATHRTIKYIYFQGKKNKRVDTCLNALMKFVRDTMFKKIKADIKGNNSYRKTLIQKSHLKSIDVKVVVSSDENTWVVKASEKENGEYIVQKNSENCYRNNKICQFFCTHCQFCIHEFSCTCLDYFIRLNMCKHIHAVVKYSSLELPPVLNQERHFQISAKDEIIPELIRQCSNQEKFQENNTDLQRKLDILTELFSKTNLTPDAKTEVGKLLDKVINIVAKEEKVTLPQKSNEPGNKKIEKQPRFLSTKKKRVSHPECIQKPSTSQIQSVLSIWKKKQESDHLYTKNVGLF